LKREGSGIDLTLSNTLYFNSWKRKRRTDGLSLREALDVSPDEWELIKKGLKVLYAEFLREKSKAEGTIPSSLNHGKA
jgi:hypothetical protein